MMKHNIKFIVYTVNQNKYLLREKNELTPDKKKNKGIFHALLNSK